MRILGIDPGGSGALACLIDDGQLAVWDMPTFSIARGGKNKTEIDVAALADIIRTANPTAAFFEKVGAMPGQGVSSMFSFGRSVGQVEGALAALRVPVTYVAPQTWQKAMAVRGGKDGNRLRASELMPAYASEWRRVKDHGRADAALIALYGFQRSGVARAA